MAENEEDSHVDDESSEFDDDEVEVVEPEAGVDILGINPAPSASTGVEIVGMDGDPDDGEGVDERPESEDAEHELEVGQPDVEDDV